MAIYKTLVKKIAVAPDKKTKQKEYLKEGTLSIVDQGHLLIGGYSNDTKKAVNCNLPVIVFGDHTRAVKYINFPFGAGADGTKILEPKQGVIPKYLYYGTQYLVLKMPDKGYARHYQHLEKMDLPVPNEVEQERIVSLIEEMFSELDDGIESLNKSKTQLYAYRQAVLKNAFEGLYTTKWRGEHDASTVAYEKALRSERIAKGNKDDYHLMEEIELPTLPNEWKWVFVGDIVSSPEYGTSKKSLKAGRVPVIRMGNMKNGVIDWSDLVYSNDEDDNTKLSLCKNDVLFNRTNSAEHVGKTSIYRGERGAIFAGYIIRVNQLKEINAQYLNYFMNSPIAKKYSKLVKTDGVNQSNINSKKLLSYPFPLCVREEQDEIVYEIENRLSTCDSIEKTIDITLQQAEAMRQSILKEAFEGRL